MKKAKVTVSLRPNKPDAQHVLQVQSLRHEETEHGHSDNDVTIAVGKDGAIWLSQDDGENFVYLYPEQIKHLRAALRYAKPRRKAGKGAKRE